MSVWELHALLAMPESGPMPESDPVLELDRTPNESGHLAASANSPELAPQLQTHANDSAGEGGETSLDDLYSDLEIDDAEIEAVLSSAAAYREEAAAGSAGVASKIEAGLSSAACREVAAGAKFESASTGASSEPLGGPSDRYIVPPSTEVSFNVSELLAVLDPSASAWAAVDEQEQEQEELTTGSAEGRPAGGSLSLAAPWVEARSTSRTLDRLERRDWSKEEDEAIRSGVERFGKQWRRIAAGLTGRSDDAVRNRWSRLARQASAEDLRPSFDSWAAKDEEDTSPNKKIDEHTGSTGDAETPALTRKRPSFDGEKRISWTQAEDKIISDCIAEFGRRWSCIEQRLSGRTPHAIRNRWQRLLTMQQANAHAGRGRASSEPSPLLRPTVEEGDCSSRAPMLLSESEEWARQPPM